jgi:type I restriction enzyme S subunit
VRLGEVVSINPDSIGSDWPFSHIKYVDISSVGEGAIIDPPQILSLDEAPSRAKRLVRAGDTVISTVRPGRRSMFFAKQPEPDWVVSTGFAVLRPRKEYIDPRFLYACVFDRAFTDFLVNREKGAAYPAVLPEDIADAVIKLPPLPEQRAIAHILGTLDDKIELNRRMSETLEQMARALFKAWFVDFEPVRAKMEGRWRRGESLPGLPAHLYDLFPDRLVDSELGEIPEGWEHVPFGSLLESTIGGDWGKDAPEDDHNQVVSIIRGTDFPDVSLGSIGKVPTRYTTAKKLASRKLQAGDIVLEISGGSPTQPTGRSILISESILERFSNPVVCASFCRRLHPKNKEVGTLAFMHLQNLYAAGGTWEYQNQSTGIANFQTSRFLDSEMVVMPSAGLLRVFAAQTNSLLKRILSNENLALVKLRDTMLPKLISGKLRVKDAERFLKERGL